jgi:hypothetical protein
MARPASNGVAIRSVILLVLALVAALHCSCSGTSDPPVRLSDLAGNWETSVSIAAPGGGNVNVTFELEIKPDGGFSWIETVGPFGPKKEEGTLVKQGNSYVLPVKGGPYKLRVEDGSVLASIVGEEHRGPMTLHKK